MAYRLDLNILFKSGGLQQDLVGRGLPPRWWREVAAGRSGSSTLQGGVMTVPPAPALAAWPEKWSTLGDTLH